MLVANVKRRWSASSLPRSQVSDLYSSFGIVFACLISAENGLGILVGNLRQCHVTRLPFDQGRDGSEERAYSPSSLEADDAPAGYDGQ
jgi:hypothetical protein